MSILIGTLMSSLQAEVEADDEHVGDAVEQVDDGHDDERVEGDHAVDEHVEHLGGAS